MLSHSSRRGSSNRKGPLSKRCVGIAFLRELYVWKHHQLGPKRTEIIQNKMWPLDPQTSSMGRKEAEKATQPQTEAVFYGIERMVQKMNPKPRVHWQKPWKIRSRERYWAQIKEISHGPGWTSELWWTHDYDIAAYSPSLERKSIVVILSLCHCCTCWVCGSM